MDDFETFFAEQYGAVLRTVALASATGAGPRRRPRRRSPGPTGAGAGWRPGRASGQVDAATDSLGTWLASTIELPTTGCWRITARHAGDTIRFIRRIR